MGTHRRLASATMISLSALLAGCGQSAESQAASACEAEAEQRSQGKMLQVDSKALLHSVKLEDNGIYTMQAPVTFDTGLQSEYAQTLTCRVQISDGQARVVGITFVF
ncbi:MAG: hypothetical protein WDA70_05755 [Lysobacteraceae bacterium]|jgi:hypothetical protein|uniref:hypothetical protein n=1 Tax=Denitratimonas sp. CY0512 TaxID=3131940 RepID=UPI0016BC6C4B|nr:hypothetical protein [Gammaproteobacteria bacterium]